MCTRAISFFMFCFLLALQIITCSELTKSTINYNPTDPLSLLSNEMVVAVVTELDYKDYCHLSGVNKRFAEFCNDYQLPPLKYLHVIDNFTHKNLDQLQGIQPPRQQRQLDSFLVEKESWTLSESNQHDANRKQKFYNFFLIIQPVDPKSKTTLSWLKYILYGTYEPNQGVLNPAGIIGSLKFKSYKRLYCFTFDTNDRIMYHTDPRSKTLACYAWTGPNAHPEKKAFFIMDASTGISIMYALDILFTGNKISFENNRLTVVGKTRIHKGDACVVLTYQDAGKTMHVELSDSLNRNFEWEAQEAVNIKNISVCNYADLSRNADNILMPIITQSEVTSIKKTVIEKIPAIVSKSFFVNNRNMQKKAEKAAVTRSNNIIVVQPTSNNQDNQIAVTNSSNSSSSSVNNQTAVTTVTTTTEISERNNPQLQLQSTTVGTGNNNTQVTLRNTTVLQNPMTNMFNSVARFVQLITYLVWRKT